MSNLVPSLTPSHIPTLSRPFPNDFDEGKKAEKTEETGGELGNDGQGETDRMEWQLLLCQTDETTCYFFYRFSVNFGKNLSYGLGFEGGGLENQISKDQGSGLETQNLWNFLVTVH